MSSRSRKRTKGTGSASRSGRELAPYELEELGAHKAEIAERFFAEALTHVTGKWAGKSFTLSPWQRDIVRRTFGTLRPDGKRQYQTVYIEIPRKNGKSTFAAGLANLLLFADGEARAEIYGAAADREQAGIVFDIATGMVEGNPTLRSFAQIYRNAITVPHTGSSYKKISADAYSKHGFNAHGIIFDELHAQPNRDLWDVLTTSTGARDQPLVVAITTAGYDRHSICYEIHEYALKVRDGIIEDPTFLPVIFAASPDDDWTKPETWARANPGLGDTVRLDYFERKVAQAREVPSAENTFKRLHLNIWTEQATRWLAMEAWDANAFPVEIPRAARVFAGLDLSSTSDISALVLAWRAPDGRVHVVPKFWLPGQSAIARERRDRVPYPAWIQKGWISQTGRPTIDYDHIRREVNELRRQYNFIEIAIDRWNATQLANQLEDDGFVITPFGQGFASMSAPMKELERLVIARQLAHGGNPVLRWMMSNVAVSSDAAGNVKPDKEKSTEKIDGIVALVMALGRMCSNKSAKPSIYSTRGIAEVPL